MHRNISRAYYALMGEHHRVRAAHMKILARGDAMLERKLLRAKEDDEEHIEEVVIHEERLSAAQRRRAYKLSSYGRKIEKRKSSDDIAWGSAGKDARYLNKLRRLLSKTEEEDRKLILYMAQKMANR